MNLCPVCSAHELANLLDLALCLTCGHVFQVPPRITVVYDASYIRTYDRYPTHAMSSLRLSFLRRVVQSGRLLDVGYGNGAFVNAARAAGFDAYGFDIHGVDYGVPEVDLACDQSIWDVVVFFDSLEHFPEFSTVRQLLARSRFVLVSVPCRPPWFPWRRHWRHYKPGEHLHYFSAESLARLIGKPLLSSSNLEDSIRRSEQGLQNIYTALFGPRCIEAVYHFSGTDTDKSM